MPAQPQVDVKILTVSRIRRDGNIRAVVGVEAGDDEGRLCPMRVRATDTEAATMKPGKQSV
jgi:hypothetical protein